MPRDTVVRRLGDRDRYIGNRRAADPRTDPATTPPTTAGTASPRLDAHRDGVTGFEVGLRTDEFDATAGRPGTEQRETGDGVVPSPSG